MEGEGERGANGRKRKLKEGGKGEGGGSQGGAAKIDGENCSLYI